MEALVELLVEVFGELVFEALIHFMAWVISLVVTHFDTNPVSRKVLRIIAYIICLIACIVLLVLSFIYAKTAYALLASIFLSINIFILGIKLINKSNLHNKSIKKRKLGRTIDIIILVLTRLSRIAFVVLMFIFLDTLKSVEAKATLISITMSVFFLFTCIDIYRLVNYFKRRKAKVVIE